MPEVLFAIPGDLATPTGGYRYDRRVMDELKTLGWNVRLLALPGDFPAPSAASLHETERLLEQTPDDAVILFDGLAYGALPADLLDNVPRRYVALVHHPLALETGLAPARAAQLRDMERETLARAMQVVATSQPTADVLIRDFGVSGRRLSVAEPGTGLREPFLEARDPGPELTDQAVPSRTSSATRSSPAASPFPRTEGSAFPRWTETSLETPGSSIVTP